MEPYYHVSMPSSFGPFSIVWRETDGGPRVYRVFLSHPKASSEEQVQARFPGADPVAQVAVTGLGERIQSFLGGTSVQFSLEMVALEICSEFQRRAILAEHCIPRGWISTYGRIGEHLGIQNGARAVGGALARNPFPIVIPCHRAIRSSGELGGYQGGLEMKRALLEYEGVAISKTDKVLSTQMYY